MAFSDFMYWTCKLFFSILWLIYIVSKFNDINGNFMWDVVGIVSIIYFIVNVRWHMTRPTPINN